MRFLNVLSGGYKRVMDRLLDLQNESFTLGNAPFANLGVDLVLSGCAVHDNGNGTVNITSGLIYISGNTLRYDGDSNVPAGGTKAFIAGSVVTSKPMIFGDGSTKNIYSEQKAIIADQDPGNNTQIKIKTKLYDVRQYIQDQIYNSEEKGTIKELYDLSGIDPGEPGSFLANFDNTGLGVTPRWLGWALDNGNNGTRGSAGMALIAAGTYTDPISGEETVYTEGDEVGARTSKITAAESPTPAGLVTGTFGPVGKPGDGGGPSVKYVTTLSAAAAATAARSNMQPSMPAYRVVKIV